MKRVFISDCEGPISKNDNAYEIAAHFVPDGDKFFSLISKYDDVLADVVKKPGYNAGDTLKLILPFLKAYEVTDQKMQKFSAENLLLIAGSKETLQHIKGVAEAFIVSTSYEHYIKALCNATGFLFENTYCTRLSIDTYALTAKEKMQLKTIAQEIASTPMITIPPNAKAVSDFSAKDQQTVEWLDEIFWKEIAGMGCAKMFFEVTAVGGKQKAIAIQDIAKKNRTQLSDVMYVGDSITDVEAFQLVRRNSGLTVSFNGNNYAVKNAELAVMSDNNVVTVVLADIFLNYGKASTLKLAENWSRESLKHSEVNPSVLDRFFRLYPDVLPKVQIVTAKNMETLAKESSAFRKKVRGEAVGKLG